GGFAYRANGDADLALTAYAMQFLWDAKEFVAVDDSIIRGAESYLLDHMKPDDQWHAPTWSYAETARRNAQWTAYIAQILARVTAERKKAGEKSPKSEAAIQKALTFLRPFVARSDDPYFLASYVLTTLAAGDSSSASTALLRLREMERRESETSY